MPYNQNIARVIVHVYVIERYTGSFFVVDIFAPTFPPFRTYRISKTFTDGYQVRMNGLSLLERDPHLL